MELVLLRHGETESNAQHRWQGHSDAPLTPKGQAQAAAVGRRLADVAFDLVVSSDLGRAVRTAEALGKPFTPNAVWREAHVGQWEGLTREEVASLYPHEVHGISLGENVRMGGGEALHDFWTRVDGAVADVVRASSPDARVLVVTHGGVIAAIVRRVLGTRGVSGTPPVRFVNASLTTLRFEGSLVGEVVALNDASHLGEGPRPTAKHDTLIA